MKNSILFIGFLAAIGCFVSSIVLIWAEDATFWLQIFLSSVITFIYAFGLDKALED